MEPEIMVSLLVVGPYVFPKAIENCAWEPFSWSALARPRQVLVLGASVAQAG